MDKKGKLIKDSENEIHDEESAFEIIELAIDDINVLTRAFNVINTICEELTVDSEASDEVEAAELPEPMMH